MQASQFRALHELRYCFFLKGRSFQIPLRRRCLNRDCRQVVFLGNLQNALTPEKLSGRLLGRPC